MTITAEALAQLRKTFTPPTAEQSEVDLLKVASKLASDTSATFSDADPMSKLDDLVKSVDGIESLLSKAVADKDGNVFVSGDVAEEFAVDKAAPVDPKATGGDAGKAAHPDKRKPGAKKDGETDKGDTDTNKGGETDTNKGDIDMSDDIAWETDLAPSRAPLRRSERMTKGQRPVPAQRGARSRMEKFADARDRAMERAADKKAGHSERTTT